MAKAGQDVITLLTLGVLGGAFISFGAIFSNITHRREAAIPFGLAQVVAGLVFALGLTMVLLGGAQIFTGDIAHGDGLGERTPWSCASHARLGFGMDW